MDCPGLFGHSDLTNWASSSLFNLLLKSGTSSSCLLPETLSILRLSLSDKSSIRPVNSQNLSSMDNLTISPTYNRNINSVWLKEVTEGQFVLDWANIIRSLNWGLFNIKMNENTSGVVPGKSQNAVLLLYSIIFLCTVSKLKPKQYKSS